MARSHDREEHRILAVQGGDGNSCARIRRLHGTARFGFEDHRYIGDTASVSGGAINNANGQNGSISGGARNNTRGRNATVSGGIDRSANSEGSWAAGSLFELRTRHVAVSLVRKLPIAYFSTWSR